MHIKLSLLLAVVVPHCVRAQSDASYSFTSGQFGDGFVWPQHQRARQSQAGLSGDPFKTPDTDIDFYNFTGNLAFFDSQNLLTSPATLINNEAWWTDVRIKSYVGSGGGSFTSASVGIGFGNTQSGHAEDFGFDLAIASVSQPMPNSLSFQVGDLEGFGAVGQLSFQSGPWTVSSATFPTLNSPYPGREARFRFSVAALQQFIADQNAGNPDFGETYDDPSEIEIGLLTINLMPIATLGGTTQFAMDNFIHAGGALPLQNLPPLNLHPTNTLPADTTFTFSFGGQPPGPGADPMITIGVSDLLEQLLEAFPNAEGSPQMTLSAPFTESAGNGTSLNFETQVDLNSIAALFDQLGNFSDSVGDLNANMILQRIANDVDEIAEANYNRALSSMVESETQLQLLAPGEQTYENIDFSALQALFTEAGGSGVLPPFPDQRLISMQFNGSFDPNAPPDPNAPGGQLILEEAIRSFGPNGPTTPGDLARLATMLVLSTYDPASDSWTSATDLNSSLTDQQHRPMSSTEYQQGVDLGAIFQQLGDFGSEIVDFYEDDSGTFNYSGEAWAVVDHDSFYRLQVFPRPKLVAEPVTAGGLTLRADVPPGVTVRLLSSHNLQTWTEVTRQRSVTEEIAFDASNYMTPTNGYFRVLW